ncbi:MAG TPA: hypothetical protein PK263_05195 [bacterium]|nr:hypothetical protein [bacterium]
MRKYWEYYKIAVRNQTAYKVDIVVNIASNMVFFYVFFALWVRIFSQNGISEINTYSLSMTVTYYLITTVIFRLVPWDAIYLNQDVWSGYFTNDLIKPWNARVVQFLATMGETLTSFVYGIPVLVVVFLTVGKYLVLPDALHAISFVITLLIGFFLIMSFVLIFHSFVFYFGDQDPNIGIVTYLLMFLSGGVFPLGFLPEKTRVIFESLPFKYIFDVPTNMFLNKFDSTEIALIWLKMILWTLVFLWNLFGRIQKRT